MLVHSALTDRQIFEETNLAAFSFKSYGDQAISTWTVGWGDATVTYTNYGYVESAFHYYEPSDSTNYDITLSVTYADGSTCDYGTVAKRRHPDATSDALFADLDEVDDLFADVFVD